MNYTAQQRIAIINKNGWTKNEVRNLIRDCEELERKLMINNYSDLPKHWQINLSVDGENIFSLGDNHLSGVDNLSDYESFIAFASDIIRDFVPGEKPKIQFIPQKTRQQFYYITPDGKVDNLIIHSGISPNSVLTLAKVHVLYSTWEEANKALIEYNEVFTTFSEKQN